MEIIRYRCHSDMDIEFLDNYHYIKNRTTYSNFINGQIKNPFDKSVYNIGYIGDGIHACRLDKDGMTQEYESWLLMLRRCYSERNKNKYPAYFGICFVNQDWHNFQNFAEWYKENRYDVNERLHLDKDILNPGNKEYSSKKCLLVPQRINELFTYKRNNDGLPMGVRKTSTGRYSTGYNGKNIGTFNTLKEAFSMYKVHKESAIKEVATEYKNIIPSKLYDSLLNYEVIIENDINFRVS